MRRLVSGLSEADESQPPKRKGRALEAENRPRQTHLCFLHFERIWHKVTLLHLEPDMFFEAQ